MSGWLTNGVVSETPPLTGLETISVDTHLPNGQAPQTAALTLAQISGFGGSVVTGITAHAGGGQTSATPLTGGINSVDTVATGADSVALPLAVAGTTIQVLNNAASNSMQVFGAGTDTINGIATGTGVAQAAGKLGEFVCTKSAPAGTWFRNLSA